MAATRIQRIFAPIRRVTPAWFSDSIRSVGTAFLTPLYFSARSGHFLSSLRRAAVDGRGQPLPWYTLPCIDFLTLRDFKGKSVLEFGGGQSSVWWGRHAKDVMTFEGNPDWFNRIRTSMPANVDLRLVKGTSPEERVKEISEALSGVNRRVFDIVVIDGLDRRQLVPLACEHLAQGGIIICDNAEGYGFHEAFRDRGLSRVDFYGHAPGVILPHSTSIVFRSNSWVFDHDSAPIRVEYGW